MNRYLLYNLNPTKFLGDFKAIENALLHAPEHFMIIDADTGRIIHESR